MSTVFNAAVNSPRTERFLWNPLAWAFVAVLAAADKTVCAFANLTGGDE